MPRQLLHQARETESKVIDILPGLEHEVVPLLAQLVNRCLLGVVKADTCGGNGIPGVFVSRLVCQGSHHLRQNKGKESVQHQLVLMELGVTKLDSI
jgi:hypothetical protein